MSSANANHSQKIHFGGLLEKWQDWHSNFVESIGLFAPDECMTWKKRDMRVTQEAQAADQGREFLKEPFEPSDIAGGVLFPASDRGRAMTGQVMAINGGVVTTG